jgi:hypothetical protein
MTSEGHISSLYADDFKRVMEAFNLRSPLLVGWCVTLRLIGSNCCLKSGTGAWEVRAR